MRYFANGLAKIASRHLLSMTDGHYKQDNNTSNGKKAIEWIVLSYDAAKGQALLISKYGLDAKQYHHDTPYPTWEKNDIRAWLNDDFLNAAFAADEQKGIVTTKISKPSFSGYSGSADTQDTKSGRGNDLLQER